MNNIGYETLRYINKGGIREAFGFLFRESKTKGGIKYGA